MGQSQSSEYTVRIQPPQPPQNRDYIGPLLYTVLNFVLVGFVVEIFLKEYEIDFWGYYFGRGFHMYRYLKGFQLCAHVVSWYIIYTLFYMYIVETLVKEIVIKLIQFRYEMQVETILQFLYGMWLANEILGGWKDLQSYTDCLEAKNCRGIFIRRFMMMMESICEYFGGYTYDEGYEAYYHDENNICIRTFRFMPSFITTTVSCVIAFSCLKIAAPSY